MTVLYQGIRTDISASPEYLCTLIQNGHEFCNKFRLKINVKNLKIVRKIYANQDDFLSA